MNRKGMTIVEIIISVTLISIVLVFLFNVLITVRNEDNKSQSSSKLLINQALIIKEIENDFLNYELQGIDYCSAEHADGVKSDIDLISPTNGITDSTKIYCLKFTYNPSLTEDNIGYLLYYSYNYSKSEEGNTALNVAGYKRGNNRVLRETDVLPDPDNFIGSVKRNCSGDTCAISIKLPVIGADDEDYGINLSYAYNQTKINFAYNPRNITSTEYGFKISQY